MRKRTGRPVLPRSTFPAPAGCGPAISPLRVRLAHRPLPHSRTGLPPIPRANRLSAAQRLLPRPPRNALDPLNSSAGRGCCRRTAVASFPALPQCLRPRVRCRRDACTAAICPQTLSAASPRPRARRRRIARDRRPRSPRRSGSPAQPHSGQQRRRPYRRTAASAYRRIDARTGHACGPPGRWRTGTHRPPPAHRRDRS